MKAAARGRGSVIGGRMGLVLVLVVGWACIFAVTGLGSVQAQVAAPALVVLALAAVFYVALLRRSRVMPVDEIGTWYVGIIAAYAVLPVVAYLVLGMEWTPFNDLRLFLNQPGPRVMAAVEWHFAAYLAVFAAAYLLVRGRSGIPVDARPHVSRGVALSAFAVWSVCTAALLLPRLFWDLHAASYAETYTVLYRLPLLVRQAVRLAGGVQLVVQLVLLVWVFEDWKRRRGLVFAWLAFEAAQMVMLAGARTEVMLVLVAATVLYHRQVRPVRFGVAVGGSVLLLTLFMGLGYWRSFRGIQQSGRLEMTTAGEFEAVFATATDIYERRRGGELDHLPPGLGVSDMVSFIPSQLLPFQKRMLDQWYLTEFYPGLLEQGYGAAFGVVPQSMVGLGIVELMARGAFVGVLFGALTRWAARRPRRLWAAVFYLWMLLFAYQSVRASTFYMLSSFIQHFIPSIVLVEGVHAVVTSRVRNRRALLAPSP